MAKKDFRKSTLVSVLPFALNESKPTLYPGEYHIPAAKYPDGIETLVIADAHGLLYLDADRGSLRVNIASEEVAKSIVDDYIRSVLAIDTHQRPGIFYLVGDYNSTEVAEEQAEALNKAHEYQRNWFQALVRIADDDWSKFHQHKIISNIQRVAAQCLNLSREWLTLIPSESQLCPMCRIVVDPLAVLCMNCKTVLNPEKYKEYKVRFGELANVSGSK